MLGGCDVWGPRWLFHWMDCGFTMPSHYHGMAGLLLCLVPNLSAAIQLQKHCTATGRFFKGRGVPIFLLSAPAITTSWRCLSLLPAFLLWVEGIKRAAA